MNLVGLIALLLAQFVTGRGLIQLFRLSMKPLYLVCFSILSGLAIFSFLPFFAELAHLEITPSTMLSFMAVTTGVFAVPLLLGFRTFKKIEFENGAPGPYEIVFSIIAAVLLYMGFRLLFIDGFGAAGDDSGEEVRANSRKLFLILALAGSAGVLLLENYVWKRKPGQKRYAGYELPFFLIFGLLMFLSAWRAYYYPPNARDMTSGPEVMAEFALKEKHIINSLFRVDLQSTNNYLKPPFITSLQVIYKMFVQPFGQTWLTIIFFNYILVIYTLLKEKLHPIVAGFAMLFFFGMPEVFGYTYLMLFDYSNMVYFFFGFYFLNQYLEKQQRNALGFAIFLFSIATYIRTETIILVGMAVPYLVFLDYRRKQPLVKIGINTALLLVCPFIVYFLCMNLYVKHYIPIKYDVSKDVNQNLGDISYFFNRLTDMSTKLIFTENGNVYYGHFVSFFLVVLATDLIFFRKFTREGISALYGVGLVYVGLAFIGYLLPLADLMHTTKRGLFKLFPFILLYYRNSPGLLKLTELINGWEYNIKNDDNKPTPVVRPQSVPVQNTPAKPAASQPGVKKKK